MPQDQIMPPSDDPMQTAAVIRLQADACIRKYVIAAVGLGLVPSAIFDIVAVSGVEIKMIRDLARIYGLTVPRRLVAYKLMLSLASGVGMLYVSNRIKTLLKNIPLLGPALYIGAFSVTGGAAIYAVGKVFQEHYETGETFLDSAPEVVRSYFKKKYREGLRIVPVLAAAKPPQPQGEVVA